MTRRLEMTMTARGGAIIFETLPVLNRQGQPTGGIYQPDVARFDSHLDALLFISAALPETQQGMTAELERWSELEGLECHSADEMLAEVQAAAPFLKHTPEQRQQIMWLNDFCRRWESAEKRGGEAFYNAPVVAAKEA